MKIIYGKGECSLEGFTELVKSIVIKYRGSIVLKHNFAELYNIIENDFYFRNLKSKSLLIHGNNQIHIGFIDNLDLDKLFDYRGEFRIISAKVNDKNVPVEIFGVDYWNLINSEWDTAGKPENYKGNYKFGRSPKKQASKGRKISTSTQSSGRSY